MKRKSLFPWLGATASALVPFASAQAQQKNIDERPNVIIIMADDIGYGDLSCNGEPTIHTPNVERVANQGVRFTDAHSVAATSTPSRYSMLTGLYSWRRNDTGIARGDAGMIIRPEQYTIADMFRDNGYYTGAIGKWHLGLGDKTGEQNWNEKITPNPDDIGFSYSYLMAATADRTPCVYVENGKVVNLDPNDPIYVSYEKNFEGEPTGRTHPELLTKMVPSHGHDQSIINGISRIGFMKGGKSALWTDEFIADSITTHAVQFIDQHKEHPFFLYLGTNDIHVPRVPHPQFVGKSGMGPRGDAILEFDWTVGKVMDALDKYGLTENTIVIVTSDNGPVVDDGYQDRAVELLGDHRPWGPFRGGKYSIFEGGTRVPLVFSWPKHTKKKVSKALVSQIDFFRSFAELIGTNIPQGGATDSQNHLNAFLGKSKKGRDYIVEQGWSLGVSDGTWKYIEPSNAGKFDRYTNTELGNDSKPQLYKLGKDINEQKNLADKYPNKVKELADILQKERDKN